MADLAKEGDAEYGGVDIERVTVRGCRMEALTMAQRPAAVATGDGTRTARGDGNTREAKECRVAQLTEEYNKHLDRRQH